MVCAVDCRYVCPDHSYFRPSPHVTQQMVQYSVPFCLGNLSTSRCLPNWEACYRTNVANLASRSSPIKLIMAKVPIVTSAVLASTEGNGPSARLMRKTKKLEQNPAVFRVAYFWYTHPYLDQAEMGSGVLVVTNGNLCEPNNLSPN